VELILLILPWNYTDICARTNARKTLARATFFFFLCWNYNHPGLHSYPTTYGQSPEGAYDSSRWPNQKPNFNEIQLLTKYQISASLHIIFKKKTINIHCNIYSQVFLYNLFYKQKYINWLIQHLLVYRRKTTAMFYLVMV
jgi:hypothetical protein